MTTLLDDAFAHHVWATLGLIDACSALTASSSRHSPGHVRLDPRHDAPPRRLRRAATSIGSATGACRHRRGRDEISRSSGCHGARRGGLAEVLGRRTRIPTEIVVRHRDDGSATTAPIGIRLAQVVHHGTDHRSQICTALDLARHRAAADRRLGLRRGDGTDARACRHHVVRTGEPPAGRR